MILAKRNVTASAAAAGNKDGRKRRDLFGEGRRRAEKSLLLQVEVDHLLLAVHLDDERHDQHQEGRPGDPRRLPRAPQQLPRHRRGLAAVRRHLGQRDRSQDAARVAALAHSRGRRHARSLVLIWTGGFDSVRLGFPFHSRGRLLLIGLDRRSE